MIHVFFEIDGFDPVKISDCIGSNFTVFKIRVRLMKVIEEYVKIIGISDFCAGGSRLVDAPEKCGDKVRKSFHEFAEFDGVGFIQLFVV